MGETDSICNPLDDLACEFVERHRRGERPALSEYIARYPNLADEIREVFPALILMEQARVSPQDRPDSPSAPVLERLGDYRIVREVGRGGMGIVYEAQQESLGRRVALKVLPSSALLDGQRLGRFQREARAAARLHHTNIVPVYGVGEHDGMHYYVMQFIDGLGLDQVLIELRKLHEKDDGSPPGVTAATMGSGPLSALVVAQALFSRLPSSGKSDARRALAESTSEVHLPGQAEHSTLADSGRVYWQAVARIGVQVADALVHAHDQGVLHRDVKPSNLLLDSEGTVWVTDFGLAKASDSEDLTHTGDVVGTLRYMAPERFDGQSDPRSDVYSLGLTLYELLTMRPAFDESDRNRLVAQLLHGDPPRPRRCNPEVPADLETVVLKAIAREPVQRYQSAADLAEDLKLYLEDRPIRARRATSAERLWRLARRNPSVTVLLLALFAALIAGTGGVVWKWREAEHRKNQADAAEHVAASRADEMERNLYFHTLALAHQEWLGGNPRRAERLLDDWTGYRGDWEWRYIRRLCRTELLTLRGHTQNVRGLCFSPDGRRIASAAGQWGTSRPGEVIIHDAVSGRLLLRLEGHEGPVFRVAFSPDGNRLATASPDRTWRLWDARTGKQLLRRGFGGWVQDVAFSPDGRLLATSHFDSSVHLWDSTTTRLVRTFQNKAGPVLCLCFSTDGRQLAAGCFNHCVKIWKVDGGSPPVELKHGANVHGVAFSPRGLLASAGFDGAIKLWAPQEGKLLRSLHGHTASVTSVAFAMDGSLLISGSTDGHVRLWDPGSITCRGTLRGHTGEVIHVAVRPDGKCFASAGVDRLVKLWDPTFDQEFRTIYPTRAFQPHGVAFSSDGRLLAGTNCCPGGNNAVLLWNMPAGNQATTLSGHSSLVGCVAFSPADQILATGSSDRTVKVWQAHTGRLLHTLTGHREQVTGVCFRADGCLASASRDGSVRIWESATRQLVRTLTVDPQGVRGVAFTGGGQRLVCAGSNGTVTLWEVETGEEALTLRGHQGPVNSVACSPGQEYIASAGEDGVVILWDARSGQRLHTLRGHTAAVVSVTFCPDRQRLVSSSEEDRVVKFWDVATGKETISLRLAMVRGVAFSPDGRYLAAGTSNDHVRIWEGHELTAAEKSARLALE
jgi:WD40 repeat protein/serine/threonine protein kinase